MTASERDWMRGESAGPSTAAWLGAAIDAHSAVMFAGDAAGELLPLEVLRLVAAREPSPVELDLLGGCLELERQWRDAAFGGAQAVELVRFEHGRDVLGWPRVAAARCWEAMAASGALVEAPEDPWPALWERWCRSGEASRRGIPGPRLRRLASCVRRPAASRARLLGWTTLAVLAGVLMTMRLRPRKEQ